ncbi:MAG: DUF815 domain-containing protein [Syntrophotaleaceae bacterium]
MADHDDLFGIDRILQRLQRNTQQFVHSYPANNVLLWGEPGNGKSAAVKGLLKPFAPDGLRLIEIRQEDLFQLPQITALLREQPYRFILFCDDLSCDEQESGCRTLKTLLEGGIEEPAANIRVYATWSQRHLLPAPPSDNRGDQESCSEKALVKRPSLADHFGLSLGFSPMSRQTYLAIAIHLARQRRLIITDNELNSAALQWALERGHHSGRVARQFIDDLSGQLAIAGKVAPLSS